MSTYEIIERQPGQHRAGHFTFTIDGAESEYTCDPHQFMPSGIGAAILAGVPADQQTAFALRYCEDRARKSLGRVTERIRSGKRIAGGVPIGPLGMAPEFGKAKPRVSEAESVANFLNRGSLKGLDAGQRKARRARQDEKRDHVADWQQRRKALIALRTKELDDARMARAKELANAGLGEAGSFSEATLDNPDGYKPESKALRMIRMLKKELEALQAGVLAASHGFQYAYGQFLTKQVDLVNDDIRIVPCMTNTTVDTERDAMDAVSDFATLDEFDGSGYSTGGQALDAQAVTIDDANDRAEFDATDEAATLGAGTRSIQGNLLILFITTLNGSLPIFWLEYASNKTPDGSLFTVIWDAEGILQAADA